MPAEYRHERQRVCPASGKYGAHAHEITVKVRVHRCRGALCLECSDTWQPKPVVRAMTAAELVARDRIGEPVLLDWSSGD